VDVDCGRETGSRSNETRNSTLDSGRLRKGVSAKIRLLRPSFPGESGGGSRPGCVSKDQAATAWGAGIPKCSWAPGARKAGSGHIRAAKQPNKDERRGGIDAAQHSGEQLRGRVLR
jgi:hypothetical protein